MEAGNYFLDSLFFFLIFFGEVFAIGHVRSPDRERDRETESEKSPPRGDGHAAIPSPPFSSRDLGHARTCAQREFLSRPAGRIGQRTRATGWRSGTGTTSQHGSERSVTALDGMKVLFVY